MSEQSGGRDFEERLLARLKAVVAERGAAAAESGEEAPAGSRPRRQRPLRLALAGAAALVVAALVLVLSSGGETTSKAFAVEPQEGGGVTIKVYSLEDPAGLERALERAGIPAQVDWLPAGTTCRERELTPASAKTALGGTMGGFQMAGPAPAMTIGVMSAQQYRERMRALRRGHLSAAQARESIPNVNFDPASFRRGQTVVISGSPDPHGGDPEGGYQAQLQIVQGPVEPCRPVAAPASSIGAIGVPQGAGGEVPAGALPAAGQFLYTKAKVLELQGWDPDGRGTGTKAKPRHFTQNVLGPEGKALPAFVPTTKEVWTAPDGTTTVRETLGQVEFLAAADQQRWEAAGSPPPFAYDPGEHAVQRDGSGHLVKEYPSRSFRGRHVFANVPKLFRLPTEPAALRLAIEQRPAGSAPAPAGSRRGGVTAERLLEILAEPVAPPALRSAAFEALAELPGIDLQHDVTDAAGRRGDALTWVRDRGFGRELIFDPRTATVLAESEGIFAPPSTTEYGVPPGTPFRETAYLQAKIVDSAP